MNGRARTTSFLTIWVALAAWGAAPLQAQIQLHGRVLDDLSGEPVEGARVMLLNRYDKIAAYGVTDIDGRFTFVPKDANGLRVEAAAVGYMRTESPILWMLKDRTFAELEIRLAPNVVLLAPLEIVALSPLRESAILENVEYRRMRGLGIHLTRQDIEERRPVYISDMLVTLPGVYAEQRRAGPGGRTIYMRRALPGLGGGDCPVQIFVDGMRVTRGTDRDAVLIDDIVSPLDVEVIEVFRGMGSIPAEFLTPQARCGVVAIWTQRGLP